MRTVSVMGLTAIVAAFAAPATAGPLEDGEAAWSRGDYATALQLLQPLANQGVAQAQATLGIMYDNAQGVPRDDLAAVAWFRKAADQGYAHAEYDLALKYSQGRGVTRDEGAALSWFQKAADHGDPEAMYRLGNASEFGKGTVIDYIEAYAWYEKAIANFPASWTVSRDRAVASRDALTSRMTSAQLEAARRIARERKRN